MKRKVILGLIGLAVTIGVFWPWYGNPLHFIKWEDRLKTSLPVALAFGGPCERQEDNVIYHDSGPDCYRFSEPREYSGIWLYEFEGSNFMEGAKTVPSKRPSFDQSAWLQYEMPIVVSHPDIYDFDEELDCYPIVAFRVRFIGRERAGAGGHLGLWEREIWPERMLALTPMAPPNCATY